MAVGCRCFAAFLDGVPVAYIAVQRIKMKTEYNRVSRLVVLPDYQGVGIGRKLLTFVAEFYRHQSHIPFRIVTSNPQLIRGGLRGWRITHAGRGGNINNRGWQKSMRHAYTGGAQDRLTVSLEYLGVPNS